MDYKHPTQKDSIQCWKQFHERQLFNNEQQELITLLSKSEEYLQHVTKRYERLKAFNRNGITLTKSRVVRLYSQKNIHIVAYGIYSFT